MKMTMERLLQGETFHTTLDEQIVFNQLDQGDEAIWSLLLASRYLKAVYHTFDWKSGEAVYELKLTNMEVHVMFRQLIRTWFKAYRPVGNAFLQAMLDDDLAGMNEYMNDISCELFSSFDTGNNPAGRPRPEKFYHGFVLGLMVELQDRYVITSNRESGYGRYDVMLEPKGTGVSDGRNKVFHMPVSAGADSRRLAFIIEFKSVRTRQGETLESAVQAGSLEADRGEAV